MPEANKFEVEVYAPKTEIAGVVAFVNLKIKLDIGTIVVKDFCIRLGKEDGKRWVGAPGKVGKDKKFYDSVHMLSKEGRTALHDIILASVAAKLGPDAAAGQTNKAAPKEEEQTSFT